MKRNSRRSFWLAQAGIAALMTIGGGAHGQVVATQALMAGQANSSPQSADQAPLATAPAAEANSVAEVVVTASRVERKGFVAPTPTTVLTSADLHVGGSTNLGAALADLPSFQPTSSPAVNRTSANAGEYIANLRDLGVPSTLVLIDGARPVDTSAAPVGFDLNMIPFGLVDHVEVVTGGASAQWGSDAVAGVLNIVLKKSLDGFQADIQGGSDMEGLGSQEWKADVAAGKTFDGGRAKVMVGLSYDNVAGVYPAYSSPVGNAGLIPNPTYKATNGQPQALFVQNLLNNNASIGGLINAGPLKGTNFGPGGTTSAFQYGEYGLDSTSGALMVGGSPTALYNPGSSTPLIVPLTRETAYGRASYDITDNTEFTLDLLAGHEASNERYEDQENTSISILNTNAYLPTAILNQMTADHITSFTLGRQNSDFGPIFLDNVNDTVQVKVGLNGNFGQTWKWDAFYSYGQNQRYEDLGNQEIVANFNNAVHAIKSPTTGQPICAIALTSPSTTCVPVDLFGSGSVSQAALNYFEGDSVSRTELYQHEVAANVRGEPISLWAGPVSVAAGFEFRQEGVIGSEDPLTAAGDFAFNNTTLKTGSYDVTEGYFEAVVPLLKDTPFVKKLDLNGAVRVSDYSTSGVLDSWKVGLTDSVTSDLLLRGTVSHDIEAPNLQQLYTTRSITTATIIDPANNTSYLVSEYTGGNPKLAAEFATTYTAGATYQPHWVPGLRLSADYYNIDIKGAIGTESAQTLVTQCYTQKIASACAEFTTINGAITSIQATYINFSSMEDSGIDMEADYSFGLSRWGVPGSFIAKYLTTYVNTLKQISGETVTRLAGSISGGVPRWRSVFTLDYALDPVDFTARVRYTGGGAYTLAETVNTAVQGQAYLDLGAKLKLPMKQNVVLYADVNNVANNVYAIGVAASPSLYDFIGRTYDVGLKLAF